MILGVVVSILEMRKLGPEEMKRLAQSAKAGHGFSQTVFRLKLLTPSPAVIFRFASAAFSLSQRSAGARGGGEGEICRGRRKAQGGRPLRQAPRATGLSGVAVLGGHYVLSPKTWLLQVSGLFLASDF